MLTQFNNQLANENQQLKAEIMSLNLIIQSKLYQPQSSVGLEECIQIPSWQTAIKKKHTTQTKTNNHIPTQNRYSLLTNLPENTTTAKTN